MKYTKYIISLFTTATLFFASGIAMAGPVKVQRLVSSGHTNPNCNYIWMQGTTGSKMKPYWQYTSKKTITVSAVTKIFLGSKYNPDTCSRVTYADRVERMNHKAEVYVDWIPNALIVLNTMKYGRRGILDTKIKKTRDIGARKINCIRSTHVVKLSGMYWEHRMTLLDGACSQFR